MYVAPSSVICALIIGPNVFYNIHFENRYNHATDLYSCGIVYDSDRILLLGTRMTGFFLERLGAATNMDCISL